MRFAARIPPHLVEHARRADDERKPIAEIWRQVGREADVVGLERPGYHAIRELVHLERERRAAQRALLIALDESFAWMEDGLRILEHLAAAYALRRRAP